MVNHQISPERYIIAAEARIKELEAKVEELEERDFILSALEGAGVDNWSGWDLAMEMLDEIDED
jgi:hypothetical protein